MLSYYRSSFCYAFVEFSVPMCGISNVWFLFVDPVNLVKLVGE